MDDKILEILMELKESVTELKLGQTRLEGKIDNLEQGQEEIKVDIKRLDTKMDNIHFEIKKQIFDFEKNNAIKHNELNDSFRFVKKKISDIEEDVFTLKEKIAK